MDIVCPLPDELEDIPAQDCPVRFDQIVKIIFLRMSNKPFTEATIKVIATWTPLLAASDDTKVTSSPLFAEFVIPQSEPLVTGGNDNTTFNGIPDYNGEGSVTVTANIKDMSSAVKTALAKYTKYSLAGATGKTTLGAIFVNKDGKLITDNYAGFPIYNFRVGSVGSEGFNAANKNQIGFTLPPDWDANAKISVPTDFDALTDI